MSFLLLAIVFFTLLALGVSVYLSMGAVTAIVFLLEGRPLAGLVQILADHLNSPTLVAVPFFVIAATFMQRGGIADALIRAANAWIGHIHGGLAIVCVVTATLFSSISGSTTATALALGVILVPAMLEARYPRPFSVGVVSASGTLGILIPPSLGLIIFGVISNTSIPRLFLAGAVPGLIQAVFFIAWALYASRRMGMVHQARVNKETLLKDNLRAIPALALPVIVLGGIYSGLVTVTEAAALSAILAIVISVFVYKQCRAGDVVAITAEAITRSASILIIVGFAVVFSHLIIESGVPAQLVELISSAGVGPLQFLLLMSLVMLLLGMFLEIISVILITVPIILPTLIALDIDPVHYAIVVIVNMGLATLTPPVGLNLFVMQSVAKVPFAEVVRGVLPFIGILFILLVLVICFPALSLWLPDLVFG
jgi:C4-dicarboxylate transporter DctM subunit